MTSPHDSWILSCRVESVEDGILFRSKGRGIWYLVWSLVLRGGNKVS